MHEHIKTNLEKAFNIFILINNKYAIVKIKIKCTGYIINPIIFDKIKNIINNYFIKFSAISINFEIA